MYSIGINSLNIRLFITALFYQYGYVLLMYILELVHLKLSKTSQSLKECVQHDIHAKYDLFRELWFEICCIIFKFFFVRRCRAYIVVDLWSLFMKYHGSIFIQDSPFQKLLTYKLLSYHFVILICYYAFTYITYTYIYFTLYIRKEHFYR